MPVQRKVFRIEESAQLRSSRPADAKDAGITRHREFTNAFDSLRVLMEHGAVEGRDAQRHALAQIAQAQAFKRELELIHQSVAQSRGEISTFAADADRFARATRELAAIVSGTGTATQSILQAAEDIDHAAGTLAATLKSAHDQGLAQDIQDRVVRIFEACNFQDLTGQRVAGVIETLTLIEQCAARLLRLWEDVEAAEPVASDAPRKDDRRFLNGPKLADDDGHSSQGDIDIMFGCA